jgi:hypothetical protein
MQDLQPSMGQPYFSSHRLGLCAIAVIFAGGNLLLPSVINDDIFGFFFGGALVVEVSLLAVASGFGTQPLHESLAASAFAIVIACMSFLFGLKIESRYGPIPFEAAIFITGIAFAGYFGALFVFRQFSLRARVILGRTEDSVAVINRNKPMSIRFMLLLTAAAATVIWIIKLSFPIFSSQGWPSNIRFLIVGVGIIATESVLIHGACVWLALSAGFRWKPLLLMLAAIAFIPILYAVGVETFSRHRVQDEVDVHYSYLVGLAFFSMTSLLAIRLLGYRLYPYDSSRSADSDTIVEELWT